LKKIIYVSRFLTIQLDGQRRNDTNKIYISLKITGNSIILGYSRKILRRSWCALKFSVFVRIAFLARNFVQIRFRVRICESMSLCARGCMLADARSSHIILRKVNFRIPGRTRDRAIRIAECIRDVRSSGRTEFLYDLWDRKESCADYVRICVCTHTHTHTHTHVCLCALRRKNYAHANQWRAPISSSSRVSIDLSDTTR